MKNLSLTALACALLGLTTQTAAAQDVVLSELYGRGVHAFYAGNTDDAYQYLSTAIDNGIQDPRAYYFRGMVAHTTGRPEEAEFDWQTGAEMEATSGTNASIGRSLTRFQGTPRLKLESIRQRAKLAALATAISRSKQRYGEIGTAAAAAVPPTPKIVPPTGAKSLVPPSATPPAAGDNPFAGGMAQGQPNVVADDAFAGAMEDPFAGEAIAAPAGTPAGADPFGGGDAGAGADPFGGGAGGDPFGGGAGADDNPFGGGGGEDPFGGDPFGS